MKPINLLLLAIVVCSMIDFTSCKTQSGCFVNVPKASYKEHYRKPKTIKYPTKIYYGVYGKH